VFSVKLVSIVRSSDRKLWLKSLYVWGFALFLCFFASSKVAAQNNLEKAIDKHIENIREDVSENQELRKIIFGDVDGDRVKDAVVQYTLEGFGGGNSWGQGVAVFINKHGTYKLVADKTVGGKFFRTFDLEKVSRRKIIGAIETCPDGGPQGLCEKPAKSRVKLYLAKGKLKESSYIRRK